MKEPMVFKTEKRPRPAEGMGSRSPRYELYYHGLFLAADGDLGKIQQAAEQAANERVPDDRDGLLIVDRGALE